MIHHRQRLAFRFEAGDDLFGVHPQLDHLQRHPAAHWFLLFGHIDQATAALADLLEQFIMADAVAGLFARGGSVERQRSSHWRDVGPSRSRGRFLEKSLCVLAGPQQFFDALAQGWVAGASLVQVRRTLCRGQSPGGAKDSQLALEGFFHGLDKHILQDPMRNATPKGATSPIRKKRIRF
jgi:hypothetical protein